MAPIDQTTAERIRSEVDDLYQDAKAAFQWKRGNRTIENAAFYRGLQFIFRTKTNAAVELADPRGESAEIVNFTRTLINNATSATLSELPSPEIPAAKDDQRSRAKAKASEDLAKAFVRNGVIAYDELYRCVSWAKQVGAGWLKVIWDPDTGPVLPSDPGAGFEPDAPDPQDPPDDEVDNGFGELVARQVHAGEISVQFVPTVDGLPDPAARTMREMNHFFHRKLLPVRKLVDMFPVDYFGKPTAKRWAVGKLSIEQQSYRALSDDGDTPFGGYDNNSRANSNVMAEIVEFWEKPTRKYPSGRLVIFSDAMILWMGPIPYKPVRLPFVMFYGDNVVPSSFYPDGLIEDVKSLQRVANRVESKKIEIINKMANPHLMVPFNSGVDRNSWGDIPGQVIHYNHGYQPTVLPAAEVPQSMFKHTEDQFERAKFMTGYSDLASGNAPTDASGRMMAFATENESRLRKPIMNLHMISMTEVMQQCLYLARQFYDDGRLVRTIGEDGRPTLIEFQGEDYDAANDLVIDIFSGAPTSHAARFSQAMEMMDGGLFGDTPEAERARRIIGSDYANKASFDPFQEDRSRAKREQLQLINNPTAPMSVKSYDIHKIHLEEHNKFRKSLEYEELLPMLQEKFDQHCEMHSLTDHALAVGLPVPAGDLDPGGLPSQGAGPPPGPPPESPPGAPSPQDGGHPQTPAPPPSIAEFNSMTPQQQNSSDQK